MNINIPDKTRIIVPEGLPTFMSITLEDEDFSRTFLLNFFDVDTAIATYFSSMETNPTFLDSFRKQPACKMSADSVHTEILSEESILDEEAISLNSKNNKEPIIEEKSEQKHESVSPEAFQVDNGATKIKFDVNDCTDDFMAITGCDKDTAQSYLILYESIEKAVDRYFFNESCSQAQKKDSFYPSYPQPSSYLPNPMKSPPLFSNSNSFPFGSQVNSMMNNIQQPNTSYNGSFSSGLPQNQPNYFTQPPQLFPNYSNKLGFPQNPTYNTQQYLPNNNNYLNLFGNNQPNLGANAQYPPYNNNANMFGNNQANYGITNLQAPILNNYSNLLGYAQQAYPAPPALKLKGSYDNYMAKYRRQPVSQDQVNEWPKYLGSLIVDCRLSESQFFTKIKLHDEVTFEPAKIEFHCTKKTKKRKTKSKAIITENTGSWYVKGKGLEVKCLWKGNLVGLLSCEHEEAFLFLLTKKYLILDGTIVTYPDINAGNVSNYGGLDLTIKVQLDIFLTEEIMNNPLKIVPSIPGRKTTNKKMRKEASEEEYKNEQQAYQVMRLAKESFVRLFYLLKISISIPTMVMLRERVDPFQRIQKEKYGFIHKGAARMNSFGVPPELIVTDFPVYYTNQLNESRQPVAILNETKPKKRPKSSVLRRFDEPNGGNQDVEDPHAEDDEPDSIESVDEDEDIDEATGAARGKGKGSPSETMKNSCDAADQDLLNTENQIANYYKAREPPSTMSSNLHTYQKQALSWMLFREGKIKKEDLLDQQFEEPRKLNDLFQEMTLLDDSKLYFNPFDGEFSTTLPKLKACNGGVLADEMGLGKTVMTIALLHANRREGNEKQDDDESEASVHEGIADQDEWEIDSAGMHELEKYTMKSPLRGNKREVKPSLKLDDDDWDFSDKNEETKSKQTKKIKLEQGSKSSSVKTYKQLNLQFFEASDDDDWDFSKKRQNRGANKGRQTKLSEQEDSEDADLVSKDDFLEKSKSSLKSKEFSLKKSRMDLESEDEDFLFGERILGSLRRDAPKDSIEKAPVRSKPAKEIKPAKKSAKKKAVAPKKKNLAGTLIILPVTVLCQWEAEIKKHSKPRTLTAFQYYGNGRDSDELGKYDVVLTTYGLLRSEFMKCSENKKIGMFRYEWYRVILDEAHYIKYRVTSTAKAAFSLTSEYRWCLTGTPLQNKLNDMFSLFQFLRIETWGEYFWWNTYLNKDSSSKEAEKLIRSILKPVLLRRTKKSTYLDGKTIIELPQKEVKTCLVELYKDEQYIYDCLFKRTLTEFKKMIKDKAVKFEHAHILELLLRLRQVCDHPSLVFSKEDLQDKESLEAAVDIFLRKKLVDTTKVNKDNKHSEKIVAEEEKKEGPTVESKFIDETIEKLKNNHLEPCSVCMEEIVDPAISNCGHIYCKTCIDQVIRTLKKCPLCQKPISNEDVMSINLEGQDEYRDLVDMNSENFKKSSKLAAIIDCINEVADRGEKVVVFSQFLGMLNLVQKFIGDAKIKYTRIDGSLTMDVRSRNIRKFTTDRSITVILISLRAGQCWAEPYSSK